MDALEAGLFCLCPPLVGFFASILAGSLYDLGKALSATARVRLLGAFAHTGSGLAVAALALHPAHLQPHHVLVLLSVAWLFLGFHTGEDGAC